MSDATIENQVIVNIFGEEYPITGSNDSGYISKIADLVDSRMKEVARTSRCKTKDKLAILTAMSIASELYEKTEQLSESESGTGSRLDRLVANLDKILSEAEAERK